MEKRLEATGLGIWVGKEGVRKLKRTQKGTVQLRVQVV